MTSFVDRLFLSAEEHAIALEISTVTNPPSTPIPRNVVIQVGERLRGITVTELQWYAVKLLTEPFLTVVESWRGIVGVCSVLIYLADKAHRLSWLDTIVMLCKEISEGFEHEDARVTSLVRMEASRVVSKYERGMTNNTVENEVGGKLSHSITTIPTWDELGADEELADTRIELDIPSSPASTAFQSPRDGSPLVSSKPAPLRVRQRPGLLWQWCCCLAMCLRCCPTRCLRLLGWQGGDWRELASSDGMD
ncbi:hypothetical protein FOL47_009512 [Perkinsus chesapeaki]|uniref:Uncharacterized protein n=1 Tax=Perkinsus chesapeaki TaxID=330153 RepID=A0A7J6MRQ1_PERCH|nr:hypothetical protein FOL47_009512 [Perkinsus chesapeaki]